MKTKALFLAGVVSLAAFVGISAGCSKSTSSSSPTGTGTGTPTPTGTGTGSPGDGVITLQVTSGGTASGAFASFGLGLGGQATPAFGTCSTPAAGTPTPSSSPFSVGANVTLTSGSTTLTLAEIPEVAGFYEAAVTTAPPLGASYTVALAGTGSISAATFTAAMNMPDQIAGPNPIASLANAITWTPVGATFVLIDFAATANGASTGSCFVQDTGTFTIPSAFASTMPATGVVGLEAVKASFVSGPISGHSLFFAGITIQPNVPYSAN